MGGRRLIRGTHEGDQSARPGLRSRDVQAEGISGGFQLDGRQKAILSVLEGIESALPRLYAGLGEHYRKECYVKHINSINPPMDRRYQDSFRRMNYSRYGPKPNHLFSQTTDFFDGDLEYLEAKERIFWQTIEAYRRKRRRLKGETLGDALCGIFFNADRHHDESSLPRLRPRISINRHRWTESRTVEGVYDKVHVDYGGGYFGLEERPRVVKEEKGCTTIDFELVRIVSLKERLIKAAIAVAAIWGIAYLAGYPPPHRFLIPSHAQSFSWKIGSCKADDDMRVRLGHENSNVFDALLPEGTVEARANILCAEELFRRRH